MRHSLERHRAFRHRFKQCRKGLGGCPVDLIRKGEIGEYCTGAELEFSRPLVEYVKPRNVRGEKVGRTLRTLENKTFCGGSECLECRGLPGTRSILKKDMSARKEGCHNEFYLFLDTHDDRADILNKSDSALVSFGRVYGISDGSSTHTGLLEAVNAQSADFLR